MEVPCDVSSNCKAQVPKAQVPRDFLPYNIYSRGKLVLRLAGCSESSRQLGWTKTANVYLLLS